VLVIQHHLIVLVPIVLVVLNTFHPLNFVVHLAHFLVVSRITWGELSLKIIVINAVFIVQVNEFFKQGNLDSTL
jgi:hypothetical protein